MRNIRRLMLVAAGVLLISACGQQGASAPEADPAKDEAAVRAVNAAWFKAYAAGDAAGVAATYANDAVVSPPGMPAAAGAEAIRAYFTQELAAMQAAGLTNLAEPSSDVGVSGDLAWETGRFKVSAQDGTVVDTGKFTSVLARADGNWKIIRDTWNSDAPPGAAGKVLRIVRFTSASAAAQQSVLKLVDEEIDALYASAKGFQWVKYYADPATLETGSVSLWASAADVDAFLQSEGYQPIPGKLKPLMKGPMTSNAFVLHQPATK